MAWKLIQDSFTYADFVFTDGNVRRFYSLDWPHQYSKFRDRELGLKRLRNLIAKFSAECKTDGPACQLANLTAGLKVNLCGRGF